MNDPKMRTTGLTALLLSAALCVSACGSGADEPAALADVQTTTTAAPDVVDDLAAAEEDVSEGIDTTVPAKDVADADASAEPTEQDASTPPAVTTAGETGYLGSYSLDDPQFGSQVTVTVADGTRTVLANALPDHETGSFPTTGNPNTISAQDLSYQFTTSPMFVGGSTDVRTTGVAVNGVKFEPGTAETVACDSGETYRVEALQEVYDLGLDFNNAHVQPTGEYHYHGASELLAAAYSSDEDLVHIGFAADGFLMYYSTSGAYTSGYSLATEPRSGTECVGSGALRSADVIVDGTEPDGTYTSDWVWNQNTGQLDACNGVEIEGAYAYLVTDTYPYIGRCLNGEVAGEAGPGGGAAPGNDEPAEAADGQGGGVPDFTEAAAALGVTLEELMEALGDPPPDLEAAAAALGVTAEELRAVLPAPPN